MPKLTRPTLLIIPAILLISGIYAEAATFGTRIQESPLRPRPAVSGPPDRSWLLEPSTFERLSSGGRRAALALNGRPLPAPAAQVPAWPVPAVNLAAPAPFRNVRVNDPSRDEVGHTNSESSIAVRGSTIVVGFNDASADVSGYGLSTDGGATFSHRRIPPPPDGATLGDPVVAFGPGGEIYYASLTIDESGYSSVGVSKSTDGGATFSTPANAASFVSNPNAFQDKPWMAVDTNPSSPFKGTVYVSWTYFSSDGTMLVAFTRSTDGGLGFDPPLPMTPADGIGVQNTSIAVAPNGTVYLAWEDGHLRTSTANAGIAVAKSVDGGANWTGVWTAATFNDLSLLTGGGGGVRASSYPAMAVDGKGTIHLAWAAPSNGTLADRSDVFYARSGDGANWTAPRKLNDDGGTTSQAFPALAAAADGSVAVHWADRRNDPLNDTLNDRYVAISRDGGTTWGRNVRVTDHNWAYGPVEPALPSGYHGDYDGIAADGDSFYLSWSDERGSDPDVYFAVVPMATASGAPDFNVSALQPYGTVAAGRTAAFDVATSAANGFVQPLSLAVGPLPAGLAASLASSSVPAGQPTVLTVSAAASAAPGDYLVPITASSGAVSRSTSVHVVVYAAGRPSEPPWNVTGTAGFSAGSAVKADGTGALHVVYSDDSAAVLGNDVFYRRWAGFGGVPQGPLKLNPAGTTGTDPALAVDAAGRVVAAWAGMLPGESNPRVLVARSTDGGASFSPAAAVTPSSQAARYPVAAIDASGNVIVAYFDEAQSPPPVMTIRSTNGGGSFGSPTKVPDGSTSSITRPGLAFDSKGNAYVVYTQQTLSATAFTSTARISVAGPSGIFASVYTASDPSGGTAFGPDIAIGPDDAVTVAYYNRLGATEATWNREVAVVRSTDGGKTFGPAVNVSKNPGQSFFPSLAVEPSGAVDVVWEDSSGNGSPDVFLSRSTDGGRTFTSPYDVSANPGRSGSASNPFEGVGGSGRAAVSFVPGGNLLVSWTDDSPFNTEVLAALVDPARLVNRPPTAVITSPAPGSTFEAGVPVVFTGSGTDPDGGPLSFRWSFGDGLFATGAVPNPHPYANPGTYTAVLTVTKANGPSTSTSVTVVVTAPVVTGAILVIPVVLESAGASGAFYTSEVTLASRSNSPTDVLLRYTASVGSGSGFARVTLAPGEQRVIPSFLLWLRGRNLPIPGDGSPQIGTLVATFAGAAGPPTVFAGARVSTRDPLGGAGSFGLFATAAVPSTSTVTLFGLQENDAQRSNLALVNAGDGPVTLRVSLQGPAGEDLGTLPDQQLGPWGWFQFNQPLAGKAASGRAVVTPVSGSSPFTAYAVLNDAVTSDGSFLPPILPDPGTASGFGRLVPVVLDVQGAGARFRTELTLTNFTSSPLPLTLVYTAAPGFGSGSGSATLTLSPGEQRILPDAVGFLRGSLPIEPEPQNVGGSLLVRTAPTTPASAFAAGARTYVSLAPSGSYGLFFTGLTAGESASSSAWVFGLQENETQRSNLAVVNLGDAGDTIVLRVTFYASTGIAAGAPVERTLAAGEWVQLNRPLVPLGISSGYASVELLSGRSRFAAYGVLNDNGTSDGSYIPMSR